jgi:hypothetical protein
VSQASPAAVKDYLLIKGANHYYADQPALLSDAVSQTVDWLRRNELTTLCRPAPLRGVVAQNGHHRPVA